MIAQVRPLKKGKKEKGASGQTIPFAPWINAAIFMIFPFYFSGRKNRYLGWFDMLKWVLIGNAKKKSVVGI